MAPRNPEECPLCEGEHTLLVGHLADSPLHQHLLYSTPAAAEHAEVRPLQLRYCPFCDFAFNALFDAEKMHYDSADYDNSQEHSSTFLEHLGVVRGWLTERLQAASPRTPPRVLEVGCGQGHFLRSLVEADGEGVGYDPCCMAADSDRLAFRREYFDRESNAGDADLVVCRHVIEHVEDPVALLSDIEDALNTSRSSVYLETPRLEWIVEQRAFWDVFHEHCNYFTETALRRALRLSGLEVVEARQLFAGQYFGIIARRAERGFGEPDDAAVGEAIAAVTLYNLRSMFLVDLERWGTRLESLSAGGVAVWGAGAKGVAFARMLDPGRTRIQCLLDSNPNKQGRFVAGTGHPIVAAEELARRTVATAIVMNPNYLAECRRTLERLGLGQTIALEPAGSP